MPTAFPGIRGQTQTEDYLDFSGTIGVGGTAQLVAPQQLRRLSLFFQNLSKRMGKSEALRAAKLKLIAERRDYFAAAHPLFWAAFTLTGER